MKKLVSLCLLIILAFPLFFMCGCSVSGDKGSLKIESGASNVFTITQSISGKPTYAHDAFKNLTFTYTPPSGAKFKIYNEKTDDYEWSTESLKNKTFEYMTKCGMSYSGFRNKLVSGQSPVFIVTFKFQDATCELKCKVV